MYVCAYARARACVRACMHACMYVCMYVRMYVYIACELISIKLMKPLVTQSSCPLVWSVFSLEHTNTYMYVMVVDSQWSCHTLRIFLEQTECDKGISLSLLVPCMGSLAYYSDCLTLVMGLLLAYFSHEGPLDPLSLKNGRTEGSCCQSEASVFELSRAGPLSVQSTSFHLIEH